MSQRWFEWRDAPPGDYAVVGDPIGHSLSPVIHMAAYGALSLPLRYMAIRVPAGELSVALERLGALGYRGANATAPLKEEARAWASERDTAVENAGCANTLDIRTGRATNTDGAGFLQLLESEGLLPPASVLLLGAGGAARGVGIAMAGRGYTLNVYNRTESKAKDLAQRLGGRAMGAADPTGCAAVVNATTAGGDLGLAWERVEKHVLAVDLRYGRDPTDFLATAASRGVRTVDGRDMLLEQAALALEWWIDREAPRDVMRKALYEAL